jgi:hypothetical protein
MTVYESEVGLFAPSAIFFGSFERKFIAKRQPGFRFPLRRIENPAY